MLTHEWHPLSVRITPFPSSKSSDLQKEHKVTSNFSNSCSKLTLDGRARISGIETELTSGPGARRGFGPRRSRDGMLPIRFRQKIIPAKMSPKLQTKYTGYAPVCRCYEYMFKYFLRCRTNRMHLVSSGIVQMLLALLFPVLRLLNARLHFFSTLRKRLFGKLLWWPLDAQTFCFIWLWNHMEMNMVHFLMRESSVILQHVVLNLLATKTVLKRPKFQTFV